MCVSCFLQRRHVKRFPCSTKHASGAAAARGPHGPEPVGRTGTVQPVEVHQRRREGHEARVLPPVRRGAAHVPRRRLGTHGAVPVLLLAAAHLRPVRPRGRHTAFPEGQRRSYHHARRVPGVPDAPQHGVR